ncbi:MAG: hypothetical protein AAFX06_09905 [Planctomycetota bacterium]
MNHTARITIAWLACLSVFSATGCKMTRESFLEPMAKLKFPGTDQTDELQKMGPTRVVTDATAFALELPESDLEDREKFVDRFNKLLDEKRLAAANIHVARRMDLAHEVLTSSIGKDSKSLQTLAATYDQNCGNTQGWYPVTTASRSESFGVYTQQRAQFMGAIANGDFATASEVELIESARATNSETLLVDAHFQTGVGRLLNEQNAAAADAFEKAAAQATDGHGMQGCTAKLMSSEASRRAGDFATATANWREAVAMACSQIRTRNVSEPRFWERAAYLQPVGEPWPDEVAETFEWIGQSSASPIRSELLRQLAGISMAGDSITARCWVEAAIASWFEARGEPNKALLHLKKAETLAQAPVAKEWLKVAQAPLLVSLGQSGTATALLAPIIAKEDDSLTMLAAMTKLGVIKLQSSAKQHGVRLLHHAVIDSESIAWPGKSSARADLALGLLMIGETSEGINQLRQAQASFEAEGEVEQLAKSLWNEQQYLEQSEASSAEIAAVSERLKTLQL